MPFYPTCSVIGHVDVGKTSFLDFFKQKKTNEVRGITQQLSVYKYDKDHLSNCVDNSSFGSNFTLGGIILIDTPGHEYFTQMRTITSSISHLVIVMIDVIKGIEPTHVEVLKYLRENHIDFIIILNKLDKIYEWIPGEKQSLKNTFKNQKKETMRKLNDYTNNIICQLAENEINACLYYNNTDYKTFISMIPLSSKSGEGISDFLIVLSKIMEKKIKLFDKALSDKILFYKDIRGFVVDSKVDDRFGKIYTIITHSEFKEYSDIRIINKNNELKSYRIKHIISNNIRIASAKENEIIYIMMEDKNAELQNGDIIICEESNKLYKNLILSRVTLNFNDEDEILEYDDINNPNNPNNPDNLDNFNEKLKLDKYGICIISLSKMMHGALYKLFKKDMNIPICICTVDKLNKATIIKASNNNEINIKNNRDKLMNIKYDYYRVIIIFEPILKEQYVDPELLEFAQRNKLTVIGSNSIYRLKEKYQKYCENISDKIKTEYNYLRDCEIEVIPSCIFIKSSPLLVGVKVKRGVLNVGTKLIATKNDKSIVIGCVKSIEKDKKPLLCANMNDEVCVKIDMLDKKIVYGADFDNTYKISTYRTKDDEYTMNIFQSELGGIKN